MSLLPYQLISAYLSMSPSSGKGSTVVKTELIIFFKTFLEFNGNIISPIEGK